MLCGIYVHFFSLGTHIYIDAIQDIFKNTLFCCRHLLALAEDGWGGIGATRNVLRCLFALFLKFEKGRRYTPGTGSLPAPVGLSSSPALSIRPQHREKHIIMLFLTRARNLSSRFVCSIFMLHTISISHFSCSFR